MNIICLYWEGKFRGRDFTRDDVIRLFMTARKWTDRPFDFYTLTNVEDLDVPGKQIMLENDWPGWWSKMELHRPDLPEGRTLYLDLDSHIINSLDPILDFPGDLVMFPNNASHRASYERSGHVQRRYQAATMLFDPGAMSWMYDKFCQQSEAFMHTWRSDQDIMGAWAPDQPTFPGHWQKKLRECRGLSEAPDGPIIITGQPGNGSFRALDKYYPWLEERAYS